MTYIRQEAELPTRINSLIQQSMEVSNLTKKLGNKWGEFTRIPGLEFNTYIIALVNNSIATAIGVAELLINRTTEIANIANVGVNVQEDNTAAYKSRLKELANRSEERLASINEN